MEHLGLRRDRMLELQLVLTIQPSNHPTIRPSRRIHILSLLSQGQGIPSVLRGCLEIIQTEFSSNQNVLKLPFHQKFNYDDLADQIGSDGGSSQGSTYSPFHGGHHASTPPHHQTTTSLPHHHITKPPHHHHTTVRNWSLMSYILFCGTP